MAVCVFILLPAGCILARTRMHVVSNRGVLTAKWIANLHAAIGGRNLSPSGGGTVEVRAEPITSLHFADNNLLVATFVRPNATLGSEMPRHEDSSNPLNMRGLFLNTENGGVTKIHDWPADSRDATIVGIDSEKNFIVKIGDQVSLYGLNFEKLRSATLPPSSPVGWAAVLSLTGDNMLFVRTKPMSESKERQLSAIWIRTATLQVINSWNAVPNGFISITDNQIALGKRCVYIGCEPPKTEVGPTLANMRAIGSGDCHPYFVAEETLFLSSTGDAKEQCNTKVMRTDGEVLFTDDQSTEDVWWTGPAVSSKGRRFAAAGIQTRGGFSPLDVSGHSVLKKILVYDFSAPTGVRVFDVKPFTISDHARIALSPDGSEFVILSGESLELFDIPSQRPGS